MNPVPTCLNNSFLSRQFNSFIVHNQLILKYFLAQTLVNPETIKFQYVGTDVMMTLGQN